MAKKIQKIIIERSDDGLVVGRMHIPLGGGATDLIISEHKKNAWVAVKQLRKLVKAQYNVDFFNDDFKVVYENTEQ